MELFQVMDQPGEEADPAEIESNNVALKVDISPWEGHTLRIGYDLFEHENQSWILSDWGSVVYGTMIKSRDAFDERERDKFSVDYLYEGEFCFWTRSRLNSISRNLKVSRC